MANRTLQTAGYQNYVKLQSTDEKAWNRNLREQRGSNIRRI